jgi:DNA invertase Pin-like site-specific DNA recombinase
LIHHTVSTVGIAEEHVFIDDSISRAEFKKRPGLIAMLIAAERLAFDVVVVRDETRLGGDANRTSLCMSDLLDAGVRLLYYFTGEEVKIEGAVDKFMINVRDFAAELEREKISQRTHEHLLTKARRGLNVGGRVYGHDNVEVKSVCGNGLRRPVADVDAGVLAWLRTNVLREEIIVDAISELRRRIADRTRVTDTETPALTQEAVQLRAEVGRLITTLTVSDDKPDVVMRAVGDRQRRLAEIDARLAVLRTAPTVLDMEARRMEEEARARLAEFSAMMHRNVPSGRQVLKALLATPLRSTPVEHDGAKRYQVEGEVGIGAMLPLDGVVPLASPAGFEPA